MLAQGEARLCERNPGMWQEKSRSPGGATERTAKALSPLRGLAIGWVHVTQGLLASLAAPWANIGRPLRGLKTRVQTWKKERYTAITSISLNSAFYAVLYRRPAARSAA